MPQPFKAAAETRRCPSPTRRRAIARQVTIVRQGPNGSLDGYGAFVISGWPDRQNAETFGPVEAGRHTSHP
jgi:hypothetical protein